MSLYNVMNGLLSLGAIASIGIALTCYGWNWVIFVLIALMFILMLHVYDLAQELKEAWNNEQL